MATVKVASLLIRTLAKPIATQIKSQATQHQRFRSLCAGLAQQMYRTEVRLRTTLLGEPAKHIRPLSETRAIENGANALAEGFLFTVAAGIIIGESWRSARSETKRREGVLDQLEGLTDNVKVLQQVVSEGRERWAEMERRNEQLTHILERVVQVGMSSGWNELRDTPLRFPEVRIVPPPPRASLPSPPDFDSENDDTRIDDKSEKK